MDNFSFEANIPEVTEVNQSEEKLDNARLLIEQIEKGVDNIRADGGHISTQGGHVSIRGSDLSSGILNGLIERTKYDYLEVLEMCREAERLLPENNLEAKTIIRSIRGKTVYVAHRDWLLNKYPNESYSGISVLEAASKKKSESQINTRTLYNGM